MRRDIQGLRGIAVLLVVAFHAGLPVPGGFVGVDVFFVISGFLITGVLLDDLTGLGRVRFGRFYARRALRLLPALALMLAGVAALGAVASPAGAQHTGAVTGMFTAVFSSNAYLYYSGVGYFDVSAELNPLLHTWTLAVEEQFYLVFPLLLVACWAAARRRGERAARIVTSAAIGALSLASLLLATSGFGGAVADPARFSFFASPTRAWEFGAGVVIALLVPWVRRVRGTGLLAAAGLACIAVGALSTDGATAFPASALLAVGGTAALLWAGTAGVSRAGKALATRPLTWIGDVSYGWYLWHWPLIVFAGAFWPGRGAAVAAAAVALLAAWASYQYVEMPLRTGDWALPRRAVAVAAACVLVSLAGAGGLLAANRAFAGTDAARSWERSQLVHVDARRNCDALGKAACTWHVPRSSGRIVLLGDSNAGQFTEGVVRAANRAGYDATVATRAHCPFVDLNGVVGTMDGERVCRSFYDRSMDELVRHPPKLVVLSALTPWYLTSPDVGLRGSSGTLVAGTAGRRAAWQQALASTVDRLNRAGIRVLIVHSVPEIAYAPDRCAVARVLLGSCVRSIGRGELLSQRRHALAAENDVLRRASAAWALDVTSELCDGDRCSTMRDGVWLYRDRYHVSVAASLLLTKRFQNAIVQALHAPLRPGPSQPAV